MFNTKKLTKLFAIGSVALGVLVVAGCGDDTSKETKVNPDAKVINVATRGTVRPIPIQTITATLQVLT